MGFFSGAKDHGSFGLGGRFPSSGSMKDPLGLGLDPERDIKAFTGQTGAEASIKAAKMQVDAAREAREQLRSDLAPFTQMGVDLAPGVSRLASDPTAQMDFLTNNPMLSALQNQAQERIFANQAARGKLGSGGTQQALQESFLTMGNQLIDQQLNRQLPLLSMGQSSAAGVGAGSADLITQAGNAASAGQMGAAQAQQQGAQNMAQLGAGLLAMFMSDERLKTNITKVGEHNDINVYEWEWNDKAESLGVTGKGKGHIAQELEKTHPHLVLSSGNVKMVNYGTNETVEPELWRQTPISY